MVFFYLSHTVKQHGKTFRLIVSLLLFQYTAHGIEIPYAYLFVVLGLFLIDILFLSFIHYIQEKDEQLKLQELSFHHYEMQQNYYNQLHKQQESVRALWHDLNKYLKAANINQSESLKQLQDQLKHAYIEPHSHL